MAKKTLEEKIKIVCWWALGLTILYFLIGAWLISDGPKFDPTKTYNLLKDTLTLTAAFLAPVAAFVLFSDWRDQHKAQKLENDSELIIKKVYETHNQLLTLMNAVCAGEKNDLQASLKVFQLKNEVLLKTKSLIHDSLRLKKLCGTNFEFLNCTIAIAILIKDGGEKLHDLQCEYEESDDQYKPNVDFMTPIFKKVNDHMNNMNEFSLQFQI